MVVPAIGVKAISNTLLIIFIFILFFIFHLFLGLAKAALPALIAAYSFVQAVLIKVGPVGISKVQFGVSYLPQQVVGYAQARRPCVSAGRGRA